MGMRREKVGVVFYWWLPFAHLLFRVEWEVSELTRPKVHFSRGSESGEPSES